MYIYIFDAMLCYSHSLYNHDISNVLDRYCGDKDTLLCDKGTTVCSQLRPLTIKPWDVIISHDHSLTYFSRYIALCLPILVSYTLASYYSLYSLQSYITLNRNCLYFDLHFECNVPHSELYSCKCKILHFTAM